MVQKIEDGQWEEIEKPLPKQSIEEQIYAALGKRFPLSWSGGKFQFMEGDFTVNGEHGEDVAHDIRDFTTAEKATIKQILVDNGAA